MTYKIAYKITANHLEIVVPDEFRNKQVVITIDDEGYTGNEKLTLMKQAANDPLYIADLNEVNNDFKHIDHETL